MKRASLDDMLTGKESRYALVIGVAKRAREIAAEAEALEQELPKKPVTLAIEEVAAGKITADLKEEYK